MARRYEFLKSPRPVIYAIRGGDGLIKIGCVRGDCLIQRFRIIRGFNPRSELIGFRYGDLRAEAQIHTRFHAARFAHEWFNPTPAIQAFLRRLTPIPSRVAVPIPSVRVSARSLLYRQEG